MARAVYEGITFSHRYHLDRLMRSRPDRSGTIRLAGGAARSKGWTQMFADVMNMPVETVSAEETGALGCCVAVAAALGDYKDAADAAAAHVPEREPRSAPAGRPRRSTRKNTRCISKPSSA